MTNLNARKKSERMTMMKCLLTISMAALLGVGCSESDTQGPSVPTPSAQPSAPAIKAHMLPTSSPNIHSMRNVDGTYDFYTGPGVRSAVEKGLSMPPGWYRLGKVRQTRVDKAMARPSKVATYSLEDAANNDIDVEFSARDNKSLKLKAGDPCVTGVVQVAIDPKSGSPTALFDVHQWVKYPNGPTVKNIYTTGVLPDDEFPTLAYQNSPPPDCQ